MTSILKVDTIQTAAGGTPTASDLGLNVSGSVLQVVQATHSSQSGTTSSTYQNFPLSASITPSSTSSKVLVMLSFTGGIFSDNHLHVRVLRDGTVAVVENQAAFFSQFAGVAGGALHLSKLDTPSTTSSVTYSAQYRSRDSGETVSVQYQNGPSTLTLIEIAG